MLKSIVFYGGNVNYTDTNVIILFMIICDKNFSNNEY